MHPTFGCRCDRGSRRQKWPQRKKGVRKRDGCRMNGHAFNERGRWGEFISRKGADCEKKRAKIDWILQNNFCNRQRNAESKLKRKNAGMGKKSGKGMKLCTIQRIIFRRKSIEYLFKLPRRQALAERCKQKTVQLTWNRVADRLHFATAHNLLANQFQIQHYASVVKV